MMYENMFCVRKDSQTGTA